MADATRSLTDLFGMLGPRRVADAGAAADSSVTNVAEASYPTKALHKFLASLQSTDGPLLLDLGPVVGSNVTFFGEQLGCRLRVEDVAKDIDRHVKDGTLDQLPGILREAVHADAGHGRRHPVLGRARLSRSARGAGAGDGALVAAASRWVPARLLQHRGSARSRSTRSTSSSMNRRCGIAPIPPRARASAAC